MSSLAFRTIWIHLQVRPKKISKRFVCWIYATSCISWPETSYPRGSPAWLGKKTWIDCDGQRHTHRNSESFPISINKHAGKVAITGGQGLNSTKIAHPVCEIFFPNGVTVRLPGEISAQTLRQLITIRPIADVQTDGHKQELLHAERHRHQPDGDLCTRRWRAHLHQQVVQEIFIIYHYRNKKKNLLEE